jgi:cell division protein FtsW
MVRKYRKNKPLKKKSIIVDFAMFFTIIALVIFGLIFMYSSSAYWGQHYREDSFFYFKKQMVFTGAGVFAMLFLAGYYHKLKKILNPLYLLIAVWILLVAALLTEPIANVHRWIRLGPVQIQPSEFAKIAVVLFLADYLDRRKSAVIKSSLALVPVIVPICITIILIALSPDLGIPILIFLTALLMMFAAGVRFSSLVTWSVLAFLFAIYEIIRYEYRWRRLLEFLSFKPDISGEGYQLTQSLTAVGSGGLLGSGIGASKMKLMYLPAGHTDFIFSIIAEEMGFLGTFVLIVLFCIILVRGIRASAKALNLYDGVLALGITVILVMQGFMNMAVSLGIIPTKGLPLPFFSYGGSSVMTSLILAGILLNITARQDKLQILKRGAR